MYCSSNSVKAPTRTRILSVIKISLRFTGAVSGHGKCDGEAERHDGVGAELEQLLGVLADGADARPVPAVPATTAVIRARLGNREIKGFSNLFTYPASTKPRVKRAAPARRSTLLPGSPPDRASPPPRSSSGDFFALLRGRRRRRLPRVGTALPRR